MFSGDVGLMLDIVGSKVSDNSMGGLLSLSPHFMSNLFSIHHLKKQRTIKLRFCILRWEMQLFFLPNISVSAWQLLEGPPLLSGIPGTVLGLYLLMQSTAPGLRVANPRGRWISMDVHCWHGEQSGVLFLLWRTYAYQNICVYIYYNKYMYIIYIYILYDMYACNYVYVCTAACTEIVLTSR